MPGAPQLITQTIPLTEVLIGVSSNIENADGAFSAQEPPTTGPFYPTGYTVVFNSQIGRFNPSGAGSSVRYELVSITSVEWQFHRLPDNDGAGCGVHITGARTVDVTGTTLSWATSGGAVSHEFLLDLGGGGADIYTRTVGYATRGEVSDGDLTGDGPGLLDDDGVQTVSWTKSPPTAGGETSIIAFGQQFDSGDDRPFVELDQVSITYTRRRLGGGGPHLGMRR
jgi:hypothetical protein